MFSNVGLAVNIHYCKDVIASISFDYASDVKILQEDVCCGKKINEQTIPCCKDEVVKQTTDFKQIASSSIQFQATSFLVPSVCQLEIPEIFEIQIPKNTFVQFYCESNAPPLYKLFRKLIYYA